jgi:glycosyltransferase 2 family protein
LQAAIQQLKRYCAWLRGPVALLLSYWRAAIRQLKRNWTWLKWPVALLLLAYLFYSNRQDLEKLAAGPKDWFYLILAFVLCAAAMLLTFYRWYLLVWAQDFPFTLRDALRLGYIGYLFGYVAPGSAGGDVVKAAMIATEQKSRKGVAAATVLLDRILGVLALFMVGALATFFQDPRLLQNGAIRLCVALLWAGSAGGVVGFIVVLHPAFPRSRILGRLVRLPKVGRLIGGLVNAVLLYQQRRAVLVMTVLISIVGHFGTLSSFYYCGLAIRAGNAAPGYWTQLLLIPIAELFAFIIPVPGGIGVLEGGVGKCYGLANEALGIVGVTAAQASGAGFAAALANRVVTIIIVAIGAGYYMTARSEIGRALTPPPVSQQSES